MNAEALACSATLENRCRPDQLDQIVTHGKDKKIHLSIHYRKARVLIQCEASGSKKGEDRDLLNPSHLVCEIEIHFAHTPAVLAPPNLDPLVDWGFHLEHLKHHRCA